MLSNRNEKEITDDLKTLCFFIRSCSRVWVVGARLRYVLSTGRRRMIEAGQIGKNGVLRCERLNIMARFVDRPGWIGGELGDTVKIT